MRTASPPSKARPTRRRFKLIISLFIIGCLPPLAPSVTLAETPPDAQLARFTYSQYHMGVDTRLVVYAPDEKTAIDACAAAFKRIAALDSIMSDYQQKSELNRLCQKSGGPPVRVSEELFLVLKRAQEVSKLSDGAFDVTAGPIIRLWRAARKAKKLPTQAEIDNTRKLVGWKKMVLNEKARTVRLAVKGMQLDLGGIAKGYADDEAQRVLKQHGVTRALVEMGGDIVVSDPPPGKEGWTIRVPNAGDDKGTADLPFANCAISTSGDTIQFAIIDGRRYSHIVDPRTGQALTNRVQVTLIAKDGLTSDPLTKTLIIYPERREKLLAAYPGTQAFVKVLPLDAEVSGS